MHTTILVTTIVKTFTTKRTKTMRMKIIPRVDRKLIKVESGKIENIKQNRYRTIRRIVLKILRAKSTLELNGFHWTR